MAKAKDKDPDAKAQYQVTKEGGARPLVAGRRRTAGDVIELTNREAEYELSRGIVVAFAVDEEPAKKDK